MFVFVLVCVEFFVLFFFRQSITETKKQQLAAMSSAMVAAPLEALHSVRNVMLSEFPDLDVVKLYEFVDNGVSKQMVMYSNQARFVYDPNTRAIVVDQPFTDPSVEESDNRASREFNRFIPPQMTRFAHLMEAVSPLLERFRHSVVAVRNYIKKEKRQSQFMIGYASILFTTCAILWIVKLILLVMKAKKASEEGKEYQWTAFTTIKYISWWSMLFVLINTVLMCWIWMMEDRIRKVKAIDIDIFERYERMLAENVFVQFTLAYLKGEQEKFLKEEAKRKIEEEENEEEELEEYCEEANVSRMGHGESSRCTLSPCGDIGKKTLKEVLFEQIEKAWAGRSALHACGARMLELLMYLAEIKDGSLFDHHDQASMWQRIHKRIIKLEKFVYRNLDVDGGRTRDQMDREMVIVRDAFLPLMRLTAVETQKLTPDAHVHQFADDSYTGKLDVWRIAINDPDCVWAAFHPEKGGLFAMKNLPPSHPSQGSGVSLFDRVNTDEDEEDGGGNRRTTRRRQGNAESDQTKEGSFEGKIRYSKSPLVVSSGSMQEIEWTVLIKRANLCDVMNQGIGIDNAPQEDGSAIGVADSPDSSRISSTVPDVFVCGRGINAEAQRHLQRLQTTDSNGNKENEEGDEEDKDILQRMCNEQSCGEDCRVVSKARSERPERWRITGDTDVDEIFGLAFERPRTANDTVFCIRMSPKRLFMTEFEKNASLTMHIIMPMIVDTIAKLIREHHERIYIKDHVEYIMTELRAFYGRDIFPQVRPVIDDVINKVAKRMESHWKAVSDTGLYITQSRFDDKFSALSYANVKQMCYDSGRLAQLTQNFIRNFKLDGNVQMMTLGGSKAILRQIVVDSIAVALIIVVLSIISKVECYKKNHEHDKNENDKNESCDAISLAQRVLIVGSIFIFFMAMLTTTVRRQNAQDRFNRMIKDRNAKTFVLACTRVMNNMADHFEYLGGKRVKGAERTFDIVRMDIAKVYKTVEYHRGLQRLFPNKVDETDNDNNDQKDEVRAERIAEDKARYKMKLIDNQPVNTKSLYKNIRQAIEIFNSCNTLDGFGLEPPFPVYEILNNVLVAVGAIVICGFAVVKLQPAMHIRYIRDLNEIKRDVLNGEVAPRDLDYILACNQAQNDVWPILSTVLLGLLLLGIIMLAVFMSRNTSMYSSGLYASKLFSKGKCTYNNP